MLSRFIRNHSRQGALVLLLLITCLGTTEAEAARSRQWTDGSGMAVGNERYVEYLGGGGVPLPADPVRGEGHGDGGSVDDPSREPVESIHLDSRSTSHAPSFTVIRDFWVRLVAFLSSWTR